MWKNFGLSVKKYLVIRGRASRLEFWSFVCCFLMLLLAGAAVSGIFYALEKFAGITLRIGNTGAAAIGLYLMLLTVFALALPFVGVAVRRNHDMGLSGWLILIPGVNLILWCMPSKNSGNYFDGGNVFEPSRIIGLALIWVGFIALFFYSIAGVFFINNAFSPYPQTAPREEAVVPDMAEPETSLPEETEPYDAITEPVEAEAEPVQVQEDGTEGYDGEIIQAYQLDDGTTVTVRRHRQTLGIKMIVDTNVYDSIQEKNAVKSFALPKDVTVNAIAKTMNPLTTSNTTEIWLRIDDGGEERWLYAGSIPDPYENDFYMVTDRIEFADEKWTVRNLGDRTYFFKNGTEIQDAPGRAHSKTIGIISDRNTDMPAYTISAVTEEMTVDSESGLSYPWLRLDIDGRSGWIYGKNAVQEDGSQNFPSPSRILEQYLQ